MLKNAPKENGGIFALFAKFGLQMCDFLEKITSNPKSHHRGKIYILQFFRLRDII
jgi:hypothetical protein